MNKIMNFAKNTKNELNRKTIALYCKVKNALTNEHGDFYVDKTVAIIICVVVGVLLMGIIYGFINSNIKTQLDSKISDLWNYKPSNT